MNIPYLSLEQIREEYRVDQDWLFEKLLAKLEANRHLILTADRGWGIKEYVGELGFHLSEKDPDIHICYVDIKSAFSLTSFQELFASSISRKFPEVTSRMEIENNSLDTFKLPALIAQKMKIRIAIFLGNSHLLCRFRNQDSFLRTLKLKLKRQENVIFCLYGINNRYFRELIKYPGPLSGLGQLVQLKHYNPDQKSASIRKLFHDQGKNLGHITSFRMSGLVDYHPFYLRLLAWHSLLLTKQTCDLDVVDRAMDNLIHHFDGHFHNIVDNLTPKQLSFLKAMLEGNQKLCSRTTMDAYQLGSSNNITRIRMSLEQKDIIKSKSWNREDVFTDPLFREWLLRYYFAAKEPTRQRSQRGKGANEAKEPAERITDPRTRLLPSIFPARGPVPGTPQGSSP